MSDAIREPRNDKEYLNEPSKYPNKWLDEHMPHDWLTVMDIDAVVRMGFNGKTDYFGTFRLIEVKSGSNDLSINQYITYAEIDKLLRAGDLQHNPHTPRYEGFYLIWSLEPTWSAWAATNRYTINDVPITYGQLQQFFEKKLPIKPFAFETDHRAYFERRAKLRSF
jgi:hypothetical protein